MSTVLDTYVYTYVHAGTQSEGSTGAQWTNKLKLFTVVTHNVVACSIQIESCEVNDMNEIHSLCVYI